MRAGRDTQRFPMVFSGADNPSKLPLTLGRSAPPSSGPPDSALKRHLDRFSRFAGLTNVTNRHTDRSQHSGCSNGIAHERYHEIHMLRWIRIPPMVSPYSCFLSDGSLLMNIPTGRSWFRTKKLSISRQTRRSDGMQVLSVNFLTTGDAVFRDSAYFEPSHAEIYLGLSCRRLSEKRYNI